MVYSATYPARYQSVVLYALQNLADQIARDAVPEFGLDKMPEGAVIVLTVQASKLVEPA